MVRPIKKLLLALTLCLSGCASVSTTIYEGCHPYAGLIWETEFLTSTMHNFKPEWIPYYYLASVDVVPTFCVDTLLLPFTIFGDYEGISEIRPEKVK
jgi:uncharacterized protein YceK